MPRVGHNSPPRLGSSARGSVRKWSRSFPRDRKVSAVRSLSHGADPYRESLPSTAAPSPTPPRSRRVADIRAVADPHALAAEHVRGSFQELEVQQRDDRREIDVRGAVPARRTRGGLLSRRTLASKCGVVEAPAKRPAAALYGRRTRASRRSLGDRPESGQKSTWRDAKPPTLHRRKLCSTTACTVRVTELSETLGRLATPLDRFPTTRITADA